LTDPEIGAIISTFTSGLSLDNNTVSSWSPEGKALFNQAERLFLDTRGVLCRRFVNIGKEDAAQMIVSRAVHAKFFRPSWKASTYSYRCAIQGVLACLGQRRETRGL
jgi:hypothetical protein